RVELLGLAEARLGIHVDEQQATQIYTLGELIDALESTTTSDATVGRNWREILDAGPGDHFDKHYIFGRRTILNPLAFAVMRLLKLAARLLFSLEYRGLERLPPAGPFILCPNHESFLDGPFVVSVLPRHVLYNIFILGYNERSEEHTSELQSRSDLVCRLLLEKKKKKKRNNKNN